MFERVSLFIARLVKHEDGQGITEYGIALAFVAVVIAGLLATSLGPAITTFIGNVGSDITNLPGF